MKNKKIAIFGFNKNGAKTAALMQQNGFQIVIFETDVDLIDRAEECGYLVHSLDITNPDKLTQAGVGPTLEEAVCCLNTDPDNLFLILTLRSLSKSLKIVSVLYSYELAQQFITAGANELIDPYTITGRKIARQIEKPIVADIIEHLVLGRSDLQTLEYQVKGNTIIDNCHLQSLNIGQKFNLIVLGILDIEKSLDFQFIHEGSDPKINFGDVLVLLGYPENIQNFRTWAETIKG